MGDRDDVGHFDRRHPWASQFPKGPVVTIVVTDQIGWRGDRVGRVGGHAGNDPRLNRLDFLFRKFLASPRRHRLATHHVQQVTLFGLARHGNQAAEATLDQRSDAAEVEASLGFLGPVAFVTVPGQNRQHVPFELRWRSRVRGDRRNDRDESG